MERSKRHGLRLSLPFFAWFLICLSGPLLYVIATSFATRAPLGGIVWEFSTSAYSDLLKPAYLKIVFRTLIFALLNTFFVLLLAYPFAFYITRLQGRQRIFLLMLVLIPSWTNFLIRIHAISDVFRLEIFGLKSMYTTHGIVVTMVYEYLPLGILPLYAALSKIDNSVIEAARDLGARSRDTFFKVLLPLTKSGIFAAAVFVFIPSLGEFLIPEIIGGGNFFVLGNFLHTQFVKVQNWPLGSAFLTVLLTFTFFVLIFVKESRRESA